MTDTKLLIFDMDGTLIDSANANFYAYHTALQEVNIRLTRPFFDERCFNGQHYSQFLPELMPGATEEQIKAVHRRKQLIYAQCLSMIGVHPYLIRIIKENHHKLYLALGTGAARVAVNNVLPALGLENAFDYIHTGDDTLNKKPHPECFLSVMEHFKVSPEETVIFEDSGIGIEAAKASGAWVMKVETWGSKGENHA